MKYELLVLRWYGHHYLLHFQDGKRHIFTKKIYISSSHYFSTLPPSSTPSPPYCKSSKGIIKKEERCKRKTFVDSKNEYQNLFLLADFTSKTGSFNYCMRNVERTFNPGFIAALCPPSPSPLHNKTCLFNIYSTSKNVGKLLLGAKRPLQSARM